MEILYTLALIPIIIVAVLVLFGIAILAVDIILWALRGFEDFGL